MKIENYGRKLEQEKITGTLTFSNPHIICSFKMRLRMGLNGERDGKGNYMSVFFQLMKGEFDDCIEWPFNKLITFVLINQDNISKSYTRSIKEAVTGKNNPLESFIKPVTDHNPGRGFHKFITQEKLHSDGFIKNDIMYIRCFIG